MVTQSRSGVSQHRSDKGPLFSSEGGKADYRLEPKCSYQEGELSTAGEFKSRRPITGRRLLSRLGHALRRELGLDRLWTAAHRAHERSVQHLPGRSCRIFEALTSASTFTFCHPGRKRRI